MSPLRAYRVTFDNSKVEAIRCRYVPDIVVLAVNFEAAVEKAFFHGGKNGGRVLGVVQMIEEVIV